METVSEKWGNLLQGARKDFSPHLRSVNTALARIMHKFFTVAPKPSALTALPLARAPRRAVQHPCGALSRAWRNALRTAFSTPRYKNLCIIRARCSSSNHLGAVFLIIKEPHYGIPSKRSSMMRYFPVLSQALHYRLRGRSRAGFRSTKSKGLSSKVGQSTGMTGQSSDRTI